MEKSLGIVGLIMFISNNSPFRLGQLFSFNIESSGAYSGRAIYKEVHICEMIAYTGFNLSCFRSIWNATTLLHCYISRI